MAGGYAYGHGHQSPYEGSQQYCSQGYFNQGYGTLSQQPPSAQQHHGYHGYNGPIQNTASYNGQYELQHWAQRSHYGGRYSYGGYAPKFNSGNYYPKSHHHHHRRYQRWLW